MADIDIKPVPVDKLATLSEDRLQARHERLTELDAEYSQRVETLAATLEEARRIHVFVQVELVNVDLAQKLARGDVVRVKCPACDGTGLKPADVMSGYVQQGSAFESSGSKATVAPVIDERSRCSECKGQRWQIMERFKG
jgi:DnaJ-class molecular chaperone